MTSNGAGDSSSSILRWAEVEHDRARLGIAIALLELVPVSGWNDRVLEQASQRACQDKNRWRAYFPGGSQDAIWHISHLADLKMNAAFSGSGNAALADVMIERLEQNGDLKDLVFKILLVDIVHPVKALRRTQRTSRHMLGCIGRDEASMPFWMQSAVTVFYTLVVLVWLMEGGGSRNRFSKGLARLLSRMVGQT